MDRIRIRRLSRSASKKKIKEKIFQKREREIEFQLHIASYEASRYFAEAFNHKMGDK